jgi:uncharacterized damage-inducible protein DinB
MKTEIQKISSLLNRTFNKGAWHGPSVTEVLQQVDESSAQKRLAGTHSIIELVAHMTSWRDFTISRLEGDNNFQVTDELNFPDEKSWNKALAALNESHRKLVAAVEKFPEEKLSELVPGVENKYTFYTLIHGIIHHDLYHIGQIILINKTASAKTF